MNKIIFNYILKNFFGSFCFYFNNCFGVILNLFEEIEFFKNIDVSILLPLMLTSFYIPSMIIKILPFIIFLSSMWFMLRIRNNQRSITFKVLVIQTLKYFLFLQLPLSFGWMVFFL